MNSLGFTSNITWKNILISIIILSIASLFIYGINDNDNFDLHKEDSEMINNFSLDYKNDTKKLAKVRYKYILDYETADENVLMDRDDYDTPLFTLSEDKVIAKIMPYVYKEPFIPAYSKAYTILPSQSIDKQFKVEINPDVEDIQDKIRFQVKVIIEELVNNKWAPVRQATLMERGPYWSLDKGPIEILHDKD